MTCDELREEYELYALGLAEDPERAELRGHLDRGCAVCTAGMRSARGLVALIGSTAPAMAPSPGLRRRILASVGVERRGFGWTPLWVFVTAFSLVAAFYFYGRDRDNGLHMVRFREQARAQAIELARLNDALAILNQPDTKQLTFGESTPRPRGRVFVNPKAGVLLFASNLPPAPAGKAYEMWLIPKSGKPAPAGLFQSAAEGTAMHMQKGAVDMAATKAVAVTLEPAEGVPQPTSQPLIVAGVSD
jgi:hypothetical protein